MHGSVIDMAATPIKEMKEMKEMKQRKLPKDCRMG
jgi:hypothetical protein